MSGPAAMARSCLFTQKLADLICERIADGQSLRAICAEAGMPATGTVFRWLEAHEDFRGQYARAREFRADTLFDEILEISDMPAEAEAVRAGKAGSEAAKSVDQRKLQIETRKWMAARLQPQKYSDKPPPAAAPGAEGARIEAIRRVIVDPSGDSDS
ncbi:terminase small subunit protein [Bosea sp. BIWAKO-01]|uniref:terminase small subunit-like protein n=1 Tax=Bosea sp. BIWAKO-01 TaxID=506668 RepID=UPI00086BBE30|nr:terminase small subunit protein [Bosea sp. BIWAKO-01]GAU85988.1 phage terminase small subunit [Bosea sp. BIWAKO-01]